MKKSNIIYLMALVVWTLCSSQTTLVLQDMQYLTGRWMTYKNGFGSMYTTPFNVYYNVDNTVTALNPGFYLIAQNMAQEWRDANALARPFVTSQQPANLINYNDAVNTIYVDDGEKINPNDKTVGAVTKYTNRLQVPYVCSGIGWRMFEADIFLHPESPGIVEWRDLLSTFGTIPDYYVDFGHVTLHELGHTLGLGHFFQGLQPGAIMVPMQSFTDDNRNLGFNDKIALQELYDPGSSGTGIVGCDKWQSPYYDETRCRTLYGAGDELNNSILDCNSRYTCKTECTNTPEGGKRCRCQCVPKDQARGTFNNNFGLSDVAVANINDYMGEWKDFNVKRAYRALAIINEDEHVLIDVVNSYDDYLRSKRTITSGNVHYKDLFVAADKVMDEIMPLVDATFRCDQNASQSYILINSEQVNYIRQLLAQMELLSISTNLKNEIVFVSGKLNSLIGKNVKEAYEILLSANDPIL